MAPIHTTLDALNTFMSSVLDEDEHHHNVFEMLNDINVFNDFVEWCYTSYDAYKQRLEGINSHADKCFLQSLDPNPIQQLHSDSTGL